MDRRNSGMTILEVLFAILIVTVGLLGAIAVFPVAGQAARKGRITDEVTIAADAAIHKFDAQYMRRPDRWIAYVDNSPNPPLIYRGDALPTVFPQEFWRTSFCLDPSFTARNRAAHSNTEQNWTRFPAFPQATVSSPRMQRLTLSAFGPAGGLVPMAPAHADKSFTVADELVYGRNEHDGGQPPWQEYWVFPGTMIPENREESGNLSWFATLIPQIDLLRGSRPTRYVLSVVFFYGRSPQATRDFSVPVSPPFAEDRWPDGEWTVNIAGSDFYSQGFGGGEVRLNADFAEKLALKSGDWVMLAGNAPALPDASGNPTTSAPIFRWYRISDVDDIDTASINGTTRYVRNATLIGGDWQTYDLDKNGQPDDIEVTVVPGVVSVVERTVTLEVDGGY